VARIKGANFPSYHQQGSGGHSGRGVRGQKGHQWIRHQGRSRRIRNLRQLCAPILVLKDESTLAAIEQIRISTSTEAEPEYGMLFLMNHIRGICDDTGIPFHEATPLILATLQKHIQEKTDEDAGERDNPDDRGAAQDGNSSHSDDVPQREAGDSSVEETLQVGQESEATQSA
jgi:hypothetical protein